MPKLPGHFVEMLVRLSGPWHHQSLSVQLSLRFFRARRNTAHVRLIQPRDRQKATHIDFGEIQKTFQRRPLRGMKRLRPNMEEVRQLQKGFAQTYA